MAASCYSPPKGGVKITSPEAQIRDNSLEGESKILIGLKCFFERRRPKKKISFLWGNTICFFIWNEPNSALGGEP